MIKGEIVMKEKVNKELHKNLIKKHRYALPVCLMAMLTVTMVACSDDRAKTPATTPNTTEEENLSHSNAFASGLGESMTPDVVQLALTFESDNPDNDDNDDNDSHQFYAHQNISATGRMYVDHFQALLDCKIPSGTYTVETLDDGGQDPHSQLIRGLKLKADGPVDVELYVRYFSLLSAQPVLESCQGEDYANEIIGQVEVLKANGKECYGRTIGFDMRLSTGVDCD